MPKHKTLTFRPREFKGSRLRCLLLTHQPPISVAAFLTEITGGAAEVAPNEKNWTPRGFLAPDEAKLGEAGGFLTPEKRKHLTEWWLAKPKRANTPNWDLISKASINGNPAGLILVEAKAHVAEFANDRCGATNQENFARIKSAIQTASNGWQSLLPNAPGSVHLSADCHYQLSNRFAFAWKLATMGVPVVLVYLGFLNCEEMTRCTKLRDHCHWRKTVLDGALPALPEPIWDNSYTVGATLLKTVIASAHVGVACEPVSVGVGT